MVMQRWEPFRELKQMDDTINRLWRNYFTTGYRGINEEWNIAIDVIRKSDELVVKASVPGIKPEDIDVSVEDNILTLNAEKKSDFEERDADYLIQERTTGSYYRALRLPEMVDTNKIRCDYEDGVLTINLPRAEEKKRKQIKVNVSKTLEAGKK
jgi:HSP20 family protein